MAGKRWKVWEEIEGGWKEMECMGRDGRWLGRYGKGGWKEKEGMGKRRKVGREGRYGKRLKVALFTE